MKPAAMKHIVSLRLFLALPVLLLLCVGDPALAADLVTAKDVEKVSGLKGIKLLPKNPQTGAGGDLNFGLDEKTLVLIVLVRDKAFFETQKGQKGYFDRPVAGLGDEAYDGPASGKLRYILGFRKGSKSCTLSSFMNLGQGGKPYLPPEKLQELARIALSKM